MIKTIVKWYGEEWQYRIIGGLVFSRRKAWEKDFSYTRWKLDKSITADDFKAMPEYKEEEMPDIWDEEENAFNVVFE